MNYKYDTQVVNLGEAAIRLHRKGGDLPDPFGLLRIYVETESKGNLFTLPKCYSICGRSPNIAKVECNASELVRIVLLWREQYM